MMVSSGWKRLVAWTAAVMICIPMPAVLGAEPVTPTKPSPPANLAIVDIAMAPGGVLAGHVIDAHGRAAAGAVVSVRHANREVAGTTTGANGGYVVHGLRGGVYQVIGGQGSRVCRLWAARTAPPAAKPGLLIVSDPHVIRAQCEPGTFGCFLEEARYTLTNPLVVGGIIAAAVAIPVAIHNANKDKGSGS
jgi:hypothetical protein